MEPSRWPSHEMVGGRLQRLVQKPERERRSALSIPVTHPNPYFHIYPSPRYQTSLKPTRCGQRRGGWARVTLHHPILYKALGRLVPDALKSKCNWSPGRSSPCPLGAPWRLIWSLQKNWVPGIYQCSPRIQRADSPDTTPFAVLRWYPRGGEGRMKKAKVICANLSNTISLHLLHQTVNSQWRTMPEVRPSAFWKSEKGRTIAQEQPPWKFMQDMQINILININRASCIHKKQFWVQNVVHPFNRVLFSIKMNEILTCYNIDEPW